MQIVGVKFKPVGEIEYFNCGGLDLKKEDAVICETDSGLMYGVVEIGTNEQNTDGEFKKIVRVATENDRKKLQDIHRREQEELFFAKKMARHHKLERITIDAEY